jgi:hypothetical protein
VAVAVATVAIHGLDTSMSKHVKVSGEIEDVANSCKFM